MSGPFGSRPDLYAASQRHAAAVVRREVSALRSDDIPTLVFSPGPDEQEAMGNDFISTHKVNQMIQQSFPRRRRQSVVPGHPTADADGRIRQGGLE